MAEPSDIPDRPVKILLVDDRPENLRVLEMILRAPERQLHQAGSGNDALKLALAHDFAAILLDVRMPDMDGFETATFLRSGDRNRTTPIVFVTAGDKDDERTFPGYELGPVDFVYKPLDGRIVKRRVSLFAELFRRGEQLKAMARALAEARAQIATLTGPR